MTQTITIIKGDGIGPEIMDATIRVMDALNLDFNYEFKDAGLCALEAHGDLMPEATLEHVNITVSNPKATARMLEQVFGWHIRWEGPAMNNGYTIHVGSETDYLSIYTNDEIKAALSKKQFSKGQPLNHVAFNVDDLAAARAIVVDDGAAGVAATTFTCVGWPCRDGRSPRTRPG